MWLSVFSNALKCRTSRHAKIGGTWGRLVGNVFTESARTQDEMMRGGGWGLHNEQLLMQLTLTYDYWITTTVNKWNSSVPSTNSLFQHKLLPSLSLSPYLSLTILPSLSSTCLKPSLPPLYLSLSISFCRYCIQFWRYMVFPSLVLYYYRFSTSLTCINHVHVVWPLSSSASIALLFSAPTICWHVPGN